MQPDEDRISDAINDRLSQKGRSRRDELLSLQLSFFRSAFAYPLRPRYDAMIALFSAIEGVTGLSVIGETIEIPTSGAVVITNHYGFGKLTKIAGGQVISAWSSGSGACFLNDDPFTMLFAPVALACLKAATQCADLIYICTTFPEPAHTVLQNLNVVQIDRTGGNQYGRMLQAVESKINMSRSSGRTPVIVIFPEGGTSGKRSDGGPASLEVFSRGYARVAHDLTLDVVPVVCAPTKDLSLCAKFLPISCPPDPVRDRFDMQNALREIHEH